MSIALVFTKQEKSPFTQINIFYFLTRMPNTSQPCVQDLDMVELFCGQSQLTNECSLGPGKHGRIASII